MILTILKCPDQWHLVQTQCCTTVTIISFQKIFTTLKGKPIPIDQITFVQKCFLWWIWFNYKILKSSEWQPISWFCCAPSLKDSRFERCCAKFMFRVYWEWGHYQDVSGLCFLWIHLIGIRWCIISNPARRCLGSQPFSSTGCLAANEVLHRMVNVISLKKL